MDANGVPSLVPDDDPEHRESAWNRLNTILGDSDDISDSESVGSINVLELDNDPGSGEYETQPGWSEMRCVDASRDRADRPAPTSSRRWRANERTWPRSARRDHRARAGPRLDPSRQRFGPSSCPRTPTTGAAMAWSRRRWRWARLRRGRMPVRRGRAEL